MSTFVVVLSRTSIRISFKIQGGRVRTRDPIDSSSVFLFLMILVRIVYKIMQGRIKN